MKLHFSTFKYVQPFRWWLAFLLAAILSMTFVSPTPVLAACDPNAPVSRISMGWDGSEANQSVNISDISTDGRLIVLWSFASNLVNNDTNNASDAFVYDRMSCQMSLVSLTDGGLQGNGASYGSSISDDGRFVVFYSEATNIVANDTNSQADVFVRDRVAGHTTRISVDSAGNQGNSASVTSVDQAISADGRYVVFGSGSTNLVANDTNLKDDVFVRDVQGGQTTRVSIASDGAQANDFSTVPKVSDNGRYVSFYSPATNLVAGDTNGVRDVFVRDRQAQQIIRIPQGVQGNANSLLGFLSGNGYYITFYSDASNLVSGDTNGVSDIFVSQAFAPVAQTGPTLTVNTLADVNDGICGVIECSLREAIIAANAAPESTVEIPPGTYTLSIAGTKEDAAATGDLDITANMTIQGTDPSATIIDANQIDRVFHITGNYTLNISNLTIRNGWTRYNGVINNEGHGGGFFNPVGTLNLVNDVVTANSATSGGGIYGDTNSVVSIVNTTLSHNLNFLDQQGEGGGAIYAGGNTILTLTDTIVTANTGAVGGIYSYATTLTMTRTLVSDNNGTGLYAGGNITVTDSSFLNNASIGPGGGIINFGPLTVIGSTFAGNTAVSNGGAIYAWRGGAEIKNSTFSGNSAAKGGAIYNADSTDPFGTSNATITNNTFYGNIATSGDGSGVYSDADGSVTLRANIFSNGAGSTCAVNTGGSLISTGYNISSDNTCSTYLIAAGDQNNTNPLLGTLQNNGGHTFTHALQVGSPAMDAIPADNCTVATDQRGITRPQGSACDIGAYESEPGALQTGPTFTVNVTNDNTGSCTDQDCSLREAINAANVSGDTNTIVFGISGTGVHTIQPTTPLPLITNPVIIDGTTQSGYVAGAPPLIELNGANAIGVYPPENPIDRVGINIVGASNVTVRGLILNGWGYGGVGILNGNNNVIEGNFIGTNATGTTAVPNLYGVIIYNGSNNRVGGTTSAQRNVISGNNDDGVNIGGQTSAQAVGNSVQGNYIGTNAAGTAALGNGDDGVKVEIADGTLIGGTGVGARNIIAASVHNGVILKGVGTINSLVQGNYIGTDVTGTVAFGNAQSGVLIEGAINNTIGGTVAGARNVLSSNQYGVFVDSAATGNSVQGNFIGTNAAGTVALGLQSAGVALSGSNNVLGGAIPSAGNTIAGNVVGVGILGNGNSVQGNYIGTDITGTLDIGNTGWGIEVVASATNNSIGGTLLGAGNLIAHNGSNGIVLHGATVGTGNAILGNSIFSNANLGIDLSLSPVSGGVTSNDLGDPDIGPNNMQNFPVLTAANLVTNATTIIGTLNSEANKTYRLEFFASPMCDWPYYREGKTYLGFTNVTTNGSGDASFTANLMAASTGTFITATATDPNNNTSEFSACVPVVAISASAAAPNPNYYRTPSVTLTWTGVTWATGYVVQWDDNAALSSPTEIPLSSSSQSVTINVLDDGVYHWRVGAKKSGGGVVWSAPQKFAVEVP